MASQVWKKHFHCVVFFSKINQKKNDALKQMRMKN